MKTKRVLLITAIAFAFSSFLTSCSDDKEGCTDSTATNYDADAEKEDGSCLYTTTPTPTSVVTISDNGSGTGTTTWTNDKTYLLDGFVFVNSGQTLTIEAGTVIKGKPGTGANASALIVANGATINAVGTAAEPIIFTFEADPLDGSVPASTVGQWGGLIVLGDAVLNTVPGTQNIEGIPTSETRGSYGGSNDADNSGTLKYISIRHGGTDIGAGNEINGLTLGGVGSGTVIDYIEVVANADDGVEFFGGAPNLKHILVSNVGDDFFDYDQGFRGKGQFWVSILGSNTGSDTRAGEHDGGTSPEDGTPYATPVIYNATYIGDGVRPAITFRDNAGGEYHNSVFHNFGTGIDIEDLASGEDSKARLDAGQLKLADIVLSNIGSDNIVDNNGTDLSMHANISGVSTAAAGITAANPVPSASLGAGTAPTDSWYDNVTYKGAFGVSATNWAQGWTLTFP